MATSVRAVGAIRQGRSWRGGGVDAESFSRRWRAAVSRLLFWRMQRAAFIGLHHVPHRSIHYELAMIKP